MPNFERRAPWQRRTVLFALVAVAGLAGLTVGHKLIPVGTLSTASAATPVVDAIRASAAGDMTWEWELVYVGSSSCAWSTSARTPIAVQALVDSISVLAAQLGARLSVLGVDLDPRPGAPLQHLQSVTDFDQYSIGGEFLNSVALSLSELDGGVIGTPAIVLRERRLVKSNDRGSRLRLFASDERTLLRLMGVKELEQMQFAELRAKVSTLD